MEKSNTRKIKDVVSDYLQQYDLDTRLKERNLVGSWESVVGKTINRTTKNIYIRDKKLYVHLTSSVARNELHMLKDELIRRLNEVAGEDMISEIVLK
jgi:predicted nucleic acid-binding Zn ribbon protein